MIQARISRVGLLLLFLTIFSQYTNAQLLLNEIVVNPPGTDDPFEFIELKGQPGTTINQIFLCVFEGDSASAGNCDLAIPLRNITLGSNGLLFVGTTLGYSNIPAATAKKDTLLFAVPGGYLENGNTTFALVFSTTNIIEDVDYDTNNDGVLDLPQGAVLMDAVGWTNGDQYAKIYGGVILTQSAGTPDAAVRFFDNTTAFSKPAWYNGDLADLTLFDELEISDNFPAGGAITPGNHNVPNNGIGFEKVDRLVSGVYPNPANYSISIKSWQMGSAFSIYSLDGSFVMEGLSSEKISIEEISSGTYFITYIDAKGNNRIEKILVQH
jgi:hypothetical protein